MTSFANYSVIQSNARRIQQRDRKKKNKQIHGRPIEVRFFVFNVFFKMFKVKSDENKKIVARQHNEKDATRKMEYRGV